MIKENVYDNFDEFYRDLVNYIASDKGTDIKENVRTIYADGTPAYYRQVVGLQVRFKPYKDSKGNYRALLPTTRYAPYKSAIKELEWIWLYRSNDVKFLRDKLGVNYWNEWQDENGTIKKGYGYQLAKPLYNYNSQVDYIIGEIKNNPNSRRIITELWDVDDLEDMTLTPCLHHTQWTIENGKLTLFLKQRSCDLGLGLVSNIFQYQVLQHLIAKECNLEVGDLIWTGVNIHIYDRHIDKLGEQVMRKFYNPPTFKINNFSGFYGFEWNDVELLDYKYGDKIKYEVAI